MQGAALHLFGRFEVSLTRSEGPLTCSEDWAMRSERAPVAQGSLRYYQVAPVLDLFPWLPKGAPADSGAVANGFDPRSKIPSAATASLPDNNNRAYCQWPLD